MSMTRSAGILLGGLLLAAQAALAAPAITGYGSAEFGMTPEAVRERLAEDGVVVVSETRTPEGDLLVDGELGGVAAVATDLRYVFPAPGDRLALVVAFHPEVADHAVVKAQLEARYGTPWAAEMTEWWFEQLQAGMPEPPLALTAWGGEASQRHRFVRLWAFDDYLSVEYLDTSLFH